MTPLPPKYVASNRPVNQRTSPPPDPAKAAIHPRVQERMNALKAKHQFGLPLTEQLLSVYGTAKPTQLTLTKITGGLLLALSGTGLALAAIEKSIFLTCVAAPGLLLGLFVLLRPGLQKTDDTNQHTNLFDPSSVAAFDRALEQISDELDAKFLTQLNSIKAQIIRIATLASRADVSAHFSIEDRHYLSESLRRYLPDTLQSYLQVPLNARTNKMGDLNQSPDELLHQQLNLLQQEFDKREHKLIENTAEQLQHQQRFLEQKVKN
nr:hypothetical protein [uncultured Undibacterium sp.]